MHQKEKQTNKQESKKSVSDQYPSALFLIM